MCITVLKYTTFTFVLTPLDLVKAYVDPSSVLYVLLELFSALCFYIIITNITLFSVDKHRTVSRAQAGEDSIHCCVLGWTGAALQQPFGSILESVRGCQIHRNSQCPAGGLPTTDTWPNVGPRMIIND